MSAMDPRGLPYRRSLLKQGGLALGRKGCLAAFHYPILVAWCGETVSHYPISLALPACLLSFMAWWHWWLRLEEWEQGASGS